MVPDNAFTSLGMEYFCNEGDDLWQQSDEDLINMAKLELGHLGLADPQLIVEGCVIRQPKAYPVYDTDYQDYLAVIQDYLAGIENLQTIGRNGMHRYNNMDHSMLTAVTAVENIKKNRKNNDNIWSINTEQDYHETRES